jgi:hypothetical protein
VDRRTKPTLSTYNTWRQLSRLQRIYRFQYLKLRLTIRFVCCWAEAYIEHVTLEAVRICTKFTTSLPIQISRANASASDGTRPVPLFTVVNPISGQTDYRVLTLRFELFNKKRQLSPKLSLT